MRLSDFTHKFILEDGVAYYNSIRMKPVFLSNDEDINLTVAIETSNYSNLRKNIYNELVEYFILSDDKIDKYLLEKARNSISRPSINIIYFILSELCNLKCKYCFIGENVTSRNSIMSVNTAKKSLYFISKQLSFNKNDKYEDKEIIFYGGEPLLNFNTMKYVVENIKSVLINNNIRFSLISNGLLINKTIIDFIKQNNISITISLDGPDFDSNRNRISKHSEYIYFELIEKIKLLITEGVDIGLSITLTEESLHNLDELIDFINSNNIKNISFNPLFQTNNILDSNYHIKATNYIIDFYKKTKHMGIYEDRIMRKIKSFVTSSLYTSDCAATSGNQIVIAPDGRVGICQGDLEYKDYFISNIEEFDKPIINNPILNKWSSISPINNEYCLKCEALGICGGGCPLNAMKINNSKDIFSIDTGFCTHSKMILSFLIKQLYKVSNTYNT